MSAIQTTLRRVLDSEYVSPSHRTIALDLDTQSAVGALVGLWVFALALISLPAGVPDVIRAPPVVIALTFVPGGLVLLAVHERLRVDTTAVLYALGVSLVSLMALGVGLNLLGPPLGLRAPMRVLPLTVAISALILCLAVVALSRGRDRPVEIRTLAPTTPTALAFLLCPLVTILAVNLLNRTGIAAVLVLVLLVVAVVPLLTVSWVHERWHTLAVWSIALSVLYHKTLWQFAGFSGQPYGIRVWVVGRWSPGIFHSEAVSAELLPNGVLFPLYAVVAKVHILTEYEVINPFLVSFLPVALFVAFRQFVDSRKALLGAALFVFAHPFYIQYPTGGRAATPVLFLGLFGLALADERLRPDIAAGLGIVFLSGAVVSHYGTAYYFMTGLLGALVLIALLARTDELRAYATKRGLTDRAHALRARAETTAERLASAGEERLPTERFAKRDLERRLPAGALAVRARVARAIDRIPERQPAAVGRDTGTSDGGWREETVLTWSSVVFFYVATLAWYLYMRGGRKFDLLPKHVRDSYLRLVEGSLVSGRTANRLGKDYGTLSVKLTKYLYLLIAAMMAIGFLVVFYRRLSTDRSDFGDRYLALATALFGVFLLTVLLPNWGGGRPMMITFTFTTVFAVVGIAWLAGRFDRERDGEAAFAVLLAVLFVLASGVASATVLGGFAPSNVPAENKLTESEAPAANVIVHKETDIETHVWMVEHYGGVELYGDTFANREKDWYRPELTTRTEGLSDGYDEIEDKALDLHTLGAPGVEPGYVMLLGHNQDLGGIYQDQYSEEEVTTADLELDRRDRVYTTGESTIYYYNGTGNLTVPPPGNTNTGA